MTSRTHNVAAVGAIALFWAISTTPTALATPAANPKPDTPNTSSWISSTSVEQCSTLDFEAHGFPKGQTLNIALDDDQEADKQPIDDTGSASGTIEIPCDFPTGTHRLHFTSTDDYTSYSPNFEVTAKYRMKKSGSSSLSDLSKNDFEEALKKAANEMGVNIKVETNGADGRKDVLTEDDIKKHLQSIANTEVGDRNNFYKQLNYIKLLISLLFIYQLQLIWQRELD